MSRSVRKKTVVAIPVLHGSWVSWIPQVAMLQDIAEFRFADTACSHDSIAAMAEAILEDSPDSFCSAGYSMGGYVALEVMRQAPQCVERLALISTSARGPIPNEAQLREPARRLVENGRLDQLVDRASDGAHPERAGDPFILQARILAAQVAGSEMILKRSEAVLRRVDSRPYLSAISCPTLVICGADDKICPPDLSKEIADGIEGARLTLLERCGHFILYEQAARLADELWAWLDM